MPKDLNSFFCPRSIAVIGASRNPSKVGAVVLKNIINSKFAGKIYPVNPNTDLIENFKCYPDINNLPEIPDLAIIALPANLVIQTLDQLGIKGVKNTVIYSSGFKETGADGEKLEKELIETANKYQVNLLGPNCLGFINNLCPINATFGESVDNPGNLRFISQSGAIAASIFDWCKSTGLSFSEFVTLGNKAVINENDILGYFHNKPLNNQQEGLSNVSPIGLYLESISSGQEFLKITKEISSVNPIFIIKPGKTPEAKKAMKSHTGAIAGVDAVFEAVLNQAGIIRCQTLEDFFDFARAFSFENAPIGAKIAIISNAGGPAVISSDAVIENGLELAEFDINTKDQLTKILPHSASIYNPVDVLGDALADRFSQASEIILESNQADALLVILTPQLMTQVEKTAEAIVALSKKYQKPIFCSFIGGSLVAEGEKKLNEYKIPSFRFPERAIAAIGVMHKWKQWQKKSQEQTIESENLQLDFAKSKEILRTAINNNQKTLDNFQANELMQSIGIKTPLTYQALDLNQAKNFTLNNGYPVVLKLSNPSLLHKKNVGGVIINIENENELNDAWNKLQQNINLLDQEIKNNVKIQIQKQIESGVEVIIGVKKDLTFGKILLFGAGGSLAELIGDRNIHLLPTNYNQVKELVEKSKVYKLLNDIQNETNNNLNKLYELIIRFTSLINTIPEITDAEINPVMINYDGVFALDTKVILQLQEKQSEKITNTGPGFKIATVIENKILASKFHECVFESETPLTPQPGQYINIKVADNRINCYSIANQDSPNRFTLLIDTTPGGPGSKFFENLKVGDKISFLGPFGKFTLKLDDGASHLLFLGTGCGCSALKSMIDSALKGKKIQTPMTLYFGLRHNEDIFWKDYFEKLQEEHPNFKFNLALSQPDNTWQGEKGHITDLIKRDFPNANNCSAYLCGSKDMIEEANNILLSKGCPKERIYFEKF